MMSWAWVLYFYMVVGSVRGSMKCSSKHGSIIIKFAKLEGTMIYMGNSAVVIIIGSETFVA